jgi:hypothetical protein
VLSSKLESLTAELSRLEADQLNRELQQIKQAVVGLSMLDSSEGGGGGATAWGVFKELLTRLQALHARLPWNTREKALQMTGASAFASLFGTDSLRFPSSSSNGEKNGDGEGDQRGAD